MEKDREKWQEKYNLKLSENPGLPDLALVRFSREFPGKGRWIDLAGGLGRNSIYLANRGFEMTLQDISLNALEKARPHFPRVPPEIKCLEGDLDYFPLNGQLGKFDGVIVSHFYPSPHHLDLVLKLLKVSGLFYLCTFSILHHIKTGFNKNLTLELSQWVHSPPRGFSLINHQSHIENGKFLEAYLFKKMAE